MAVYLRIDDKDDLNWLKRLIENSLAADPNDPRLQVNYLHLYAWNKYLTDNIVTVNEIVGAVGDKDLNTILAQEDLEKIKAKRAKAEAVKQTKPRGRPPKKVSQAELKRRAAAERAKLLAKRQQEVQEDPFTCSAHTTYHGKRRPRTNCEECWGIYKHLHPNEWQKVWAAFQREQKKQQT